MGMNSRETNRKPKSEKKRELGGESMKVYTGGTLKEEGDSHKEGGG